MEDEVKTICITGAKLITETGIIDPGGVILKNGIIDVLGRQSEIRAPHGAHLIDAHGCWLTPGFIDLQVNGGFGHDFVREPTSIWESAKRLPETGVTSFLPTIISSPQEAIKQAQDVLLMGEPDGFHGARPIGLHLEGPFLNPEKRGAHNLEDIRLPSLEEIQDWSSKSIVRIVTLAPEQLGALPVIRKLRSRGVVVAAGHSMASYKQACEGIEAGIRYGTHVFNAMREIHHREPGIVGALLEDKRVILGVIADGIHLHPSMIKLLWKVLGNARISIVSDAAAPLGLGPGTYNIGETEILVESQRAYLEDGTLAGSVTPLISALRNLITFTGSSIGEAIACITSTPASVLGLAEQKGILSSGHDADLVLLTPEIEVACTLVEGKIIFHDPDRISI